MERYTVKIQFKGQTYFGGHLDSSPWIKNCKNKQEVAEMLELIDDTVANATVTDNASNQIIQTVKPQN